MERLLKYLSVFLISFGILFISVPASASEVTKENYETFYSYLINSSTTHGIKCFIYDFDTDLVDKTFTLELTEPLYIDHIVCSGQYFGLVNITCEDGTILSCDPASSITQSMSYYIRKNVVKLDFTFTYWSVYTENAVGIFICPVSSSGSVSFNSKDLVKQSQYIECTNTDVSEPDDDLNFDPGNVNPPSFDAGDGSTDGVIGGIINVIVDFFKELLANGIKIIKYAIALGVIFIGGKWLWRKLRQWLNNI